ncbi:alpha/beta hydrolase [Allosphingosinicella flava]|uniref:Alpha/beta hydrolase n=2 Tax=Allosphingosinicella flava TaxID=2771430 RepID=A0A7T2GMM6_9SPHN|nr:alpha/beta hydrolase [Sphingosinicella flava]
MNEGLERIALSTGVMLAVRMAGPREADPILFLHGFPESHRTWRHQVADLSRDHFCVAPDQRGFGASDKPGAVKAYKTDRIIEDLIALADQLGIGRFTLVGHDWGGAASWLAALRHPDRVVRLVIVNAPHPLIFQKSLIDDPEQRAASQYIRAFRNPLMETGVRAMGLERFFEKSFGAHVDLARIPEEEKQAYLRDWGREGALTAMLNWYRASNIKVPKTGRRAMKPLWTHAPFPKLKMPVLVVWGMKDKALLPVQLEGLDALVDDLALVRVEDAGHFVPWEKPDAVTGAIRDFLST